MFLLGDGSLLRTAFAYLIFNAIRHKPQRTQMTVDRHRRGEHADLVVHDDGMGIPVRHLPRLTERFHQVDEGRSSGSGGTGLGLDRPANDRCA